MLEFFFVEIYDISFFAYTFCFLYDKQKKTLIWSPRVQQYLVRGVCEKKMKQKVSTIIIILIIDKHAGTFGERM